MDRADRQARAGDCYFVSVATDAQGQHPARGHRFRQTNPVVFCFIDAMANDLVLPETIGIVRINSYHRILHDRSFVDWLDWPRGEGERSRLVLRYCQPAGDGGGSPDASAGSSGVPPTALLDAQRVERGGGARRAIAAACLSRSGEAEFRCSASGSRAVPAEPAGLPAAPRSPLSGRPSHRNAISVTCIVLGVPVAAMNRRSGVSRPVAPSIIEFGNLDPCFAYRRPEAMAERSTAPRRR